MDEGDDRAPSADLCQRMSIHKDSVYSSESCFPLHADNLQSNQSTPNTPYQRPDSSTNVTSITENFEPSGPYFRSSPDALSYSGCQFHGVYPDFSRNSRSDSLLNSVVRTRRRKAGISEEDRICIVCGEPASGYNFDRLTCESCKAFFRRNALKPRDKIKSCSRGGGCTIEGNQRKHCPSCRLEKCFSVGMKRELILPPEKLEQRAKPRRRKQHSPEDGSCSPQPMSLTTPSVISIGVTNAHPPFLSSSPLTTASNPTLVTSGTGALDSYRPTSLATPVYTSSDLGYATMHSTVTNIDSFTAANVVYRSRVDQLSSVCTVSGVVDPTFKAVSRTARPDRSSSRLVPCRHTHGRTSCRHQRCRRISRSTQSSEICDDVRNLHFMDSTAFEGPDTLLLSCLGECVQRIREPFAPDEQLETGVAVTLEQEYNRMDACIRRIIRVVKVLPYFSEIGKPIQLSLLRTNIYGLIVLYSSFFFESDIRKLRYPVSQIDGSSTIVTVSMLDEMVTPHSNSLSGSAGECARLQTPDPKSNTSSVGPDLSTRSDRKCTAELREEFELYKANTLAAFEHLDQLIGSDDILRVTVLAVKLFTDDSLPSDESQISIESARQAYLFFLWSYLHWRAGIKRLRSATELYARLLFAFIDLRTLEIRMTEFAKLLSLDGLSPLMREVCSQRNASLSSSRT